MITGQEECINEYFCGNITMPLRECLVFILRGLRKKSYRAAEKGFSFPGNDREKKEYESIIRNNKFLSEIFNVRNGLVEFQDNLSKEEKLEIIDTVKREYKPRLMT